MSATRRTLLKPLKSFPISSEFYKLCFDFSRKFAFIFNQGLIWSFLEWKIVNCEGYNLNQLKHFYLILWKIYDAEVIILVLVGLIIYFV